MTIQEKVTLLKQYNQSCPLVGDFNGERPGFYFCDSDSSFSKLETQILRGNIQWIQRYLPFYKYKMAWVKIVYKLYNSYKGQKALTSGIETPISINEGKLLMKSDLYTNYLKYDRLVKHAVVRCMKHPLNK